MYIQDITQAQIKALFPRRDPDSHKGDFGRLLCITGSRRMPGASILSTYAALRSGAGLVTVATAAKNITALSVSCPEAMYLPLATNDAGSIIMGGNEGVIFDQLTKADAVLFGCGAGLHEQSEALLKFICRYANGTLIIDADGLNALAPCIEILDKRKNPTILTPHPGEMSRLVKRKVSYVQKNREIVLEELCAALTGVTVVLKGRGTLVGRGRECRKNPTGNPGMSRGGSGDVLAGMIAAFAAQGMSPFDAATAGVYIHGRAGDIAAKKYSQAAMLPRDIIECIGEVFLEIEK